jgi:hypothetical protein
MTPKAETLIQRAENGERLSASERRHAVGFMMATKSEVPPTALADLFKVSRRQIFFDMKKIREEKAQEIKKDDIGLVIADIALSFENQVRDIEASKKRATPGSSVYLEHCKAIFNLQTQKVKALQELGFYPKNLGNMTVEKFEYKAIVSKDGSVDTRPVNLILPGDEKDEPDVKEADFKMLPPPESGDDAVD